MTVHDRVVLEACEAGLAHRLWELRDDPSSADVATIQAELLGVRNTLAGIYASLPTDAPDTSRAERIARTVHYGQTDKAGAPYIDHPRRVAGHTDGSPEQVATAWLHDVLEDGPFNNTEFRYGMAVIARDVSPHVAVAVHLVTKYPADGVDNLLGYYCRIREHDLARAVKLADIRDNTDPSRPELPDPDERAWLAAKYARALTILRGQPGRDCTETG